VDGDREVEPLHEVPKAPSPRAGGDDEAADDAGAELVGNR
jgi:hypothetical protein